MPDTQNVPAYDWDEHFEIAAILRELDLFQQQITHRVPMQKGLIQHYLVREFRDAAHDGSTILLDDCYRAIAQAVDRVTVLADRHADRSAGRAHMICHYLEDLGKHFHEDRWRPFVQKEIETRGLQLNDMRDHLNFILPVYFEDGVMTHDDTMWELARQAVDMELSRYQEIRDGFLSGQSTTVKGRSLEVSSRTLSQQQDAMAVTALDHAGIQIELLEEGIRLLTTIKLIAGNLPTVHKDYMASQVEALSQLTGDLIVSTDFTLMDAADQRNSAELSRSVNRPIFKASYP